MLPPSEGTEILLKQLAWENANTLCQAPDFHIVSSQSEIPHY